MLLAIPLQFLNDIMIVYIEREISTNISYQSTSSFDIEFF